jgi:hypothetical protein
MLSFAWATLASAEPFVRLFKSGQADRSTVD